MDLQSFIRKIINFFLPSKLSKDKPVIPTQKEEVILETKKQTPIQEKIVIPEILTEKPIEKQIITLQKPSDRITKNVLGITFTFDKETYKKFQEEFSNNEDEDWEIDYDDNGCYLRRIKKNGYYEYFHRWLMQEEIEKFAKKYNLKTSDVIVHHRNHIHTDNRMSNLGLVSRKEHNEHHKKEKAYLGWKGTRESFEKWWWEHHKE